MINNYIKIFNHRQLHAKSLEPVRASRVVEHFVFFDDAIPDEIKTARKRASNIVDTMRRDGFIPILCAFSEVFSCPDMPVIGERKLHGARTASDVSDL